MATKKNTVKVTAAQPQGTPVQSQALNAGTTTPAKVVPVGPPTPGAPIVPAGFVPIESTELKALKHPLPIQVSHARGVAAELATLSTQPVWQGVEASGMASPGQLSKLMTLAADWSDESKNTKAWGVYSGEQRATLWDMVLAAMEQFAPMLTAYLAANPSMAASVSATESFIGARGTLAQRAATTKNAPKVAQARATKADQNAVKAHQVADAETAAATARHTGNATITQPAPSSTGAAPAPTSATPTPAPAKGGTTLT